MLFCAVKTTSLLRSCLGSSSCVPAGSSGDDMSLARAIEELRKILEHTQRSLDISIHTLGAVF